MYVHVYASVCVYVRHVTGVCLEVKDQYLPWSISILYIFKMLFILFLSPICTWPWRPEGDIRFPGAGIQVVVCCSTWVLEI